MEKQTGERAKFDWKGALDKSICTKCHTYFKLGCSQCARLHAEGFPRTTDEVQHPDFFSTMKGDAIEVGGFTLRFYRRA